MLFLFCFSRDKCLFVTLDIPEMISKECDGLECKLILLLLPLSAMVKVFFFFGGFHIVIIKIKSYGSYLEQNFPEVVTIYQYCFCDFFFFLYITYFFIHFERFISIRKETCSLFLGIILRFQLLGNYFLLCLIHHRSGVAKSFPNVPMPVVEINAWEQSLRTWQLVLLP